jgi:hypothetical protein
MLKEKKGRWREGKTIEEKGWDAFPLSNGMMLFFLLFKCDAVDLI